MSETANGLSLQERREEKKRAALGASVPEAASTGRDTTPQSAIPPEVQTPMTSEQIEQLLEATRKVLRQAEVSQLTAIRLLGKDAGNLLSASEFKRASEYVEASSKEKPSVLQIELTPTSRLVPQELAQAIERLGSPTNLELLSALAEALAVSEPVSAEQLQQAQQPLAASLSALDARVAALQEALDAAAARPSAPAPTTTSVSEASRARIVASVRTAVAEELAQANASHQDAQRQLHEAARRAAWSVNLASIAKVAAATVPFALAAWALAMLVGGVGQMFGVGPLFQWAWTAFGHAEHWWSKALIGVGTVAAATGVCWVVYRAGRVMHDVYRRGY